MSFSVQNRPNTMTSLIPPSTDASKDAARSAETREAKGIHATDGVDGERQGVGFAFGLDPTSAAFSEAVQGMFSSSTQSLWKGIADALQDKGTFYEFLKGLAGSQGAVGAQGPQDASATAAINQLELQRQGDPAISGEQMNNLIINGAGDHDGQAAGAEYAQLAAYVDANRASLSPAALAVWDQYQATVADAQAQGNSGIAVADWDAMASQLQNTVGLYATAEANGKTGPNGEVDLNDPELLAMHQGEASYVDTENGELFGENGPQATDVAQGEAGDCYFLATLAAVAAKDPDAIKDMIRDNGDGTYDVRFYYEAPPESGQMHEEWVTVDDDLARFQDGSEVYADAADGDGDGKEEMWVGIVEKAFAEFNDNHPGLLAGDGGGPGMEGIGNGGYGDEAYTLITGEAGNWVNTEDVSDDELWDILSSANDGNVVTAATAGGDDSVLIADGIAGGHLYSVLGTDTYNGEQYVILRNPWGTVEPGMDPDDPSTWGDGVFAISLEDYKKYFIETDYGTGDVSDNHSQLASQMNVGNFRG